MVYGWLVDPHFHRLDTASTIPEEQDGAHHPEASGPGSRALLEPG